MESCTTVVAEAAQSLAESHTSSPFLGEVRVGGVVVHGCVSCLGTKSRKEGKKEALFDSGMPVSYLPRAFRWPFCVRSGSETKAKASTRGESWPRRFRLALDARYQRLYLSLSRPRFRNLRCVLLHSSGCLGGYSKQTRINKSQAGLVRLRPERVVDLLPRIEQGVRRCNSPRFAFR